MKLAVHILQEPSLEFGNGVTSPDPKEGLALGGPVSRAAGSPLATIRLGLVAPVGDAESICGWFARMDGMLLANERNGRRFPPFPGLEKAFGCRFEIPEQFTRQIDVRQLREANSLPRRSRFDCLLSLYADRVTSLFADDRPDCILVSLPDEVADLRIANPRLRPEEIINLERLRGEDEAKQLSLFDSMGGDQSLLDLLPQAEDLLYRNLYRALKARCMMAPNPIPFQVLRPESFLGSETSQSEATRAWNLGVGLYYKAGNIPWRPVGVARGTCFVGISFHHLRRRSGDLMYASLAQAFSEDTEPFALKGAALPRDQSRDRQPYLTAPQAADLASRVVAHYRQRTGFEPTRIVFHKTTRYQPEEMDGFSHELTPHVATHELVTVRPTGFRLVRRGQTEPARGTLCVLNDDKRYLFTTGYVDCWKEYPGPHIPAPLEIESGQGVDIEDAAQEILMLSKMNWNSADGVGKWPITLSFARRVGLVMTELDDSLEPNPLYRFYM